MNAADNDGMEISILNGYDDSPVAVDNTFHGGGVRHGIHKTIEASDKPGFGWDLVVS
jgi:hypothetical protein